MKKALLLIFAFCSINAGQVKSDIKQETNEKIIKIAVLGSSLASGWVTSYRKKYDMQNGYAARLGRLLKPKGFEIKNVSVPGDNTDRILDRIEKDLLPLKPEFVIIGLSLGNEGLEDGNIDSVYNHFLVNMNKILSICKNNNIKPIIGSCYSSNSYNEKQYNYVKKMNIELNKFNAPVINFLGSIDDGKGNMPIGSNYDEDHPNNKGHEEMFYAIPPSLFEAMEMKKSYSTVLNDERFVTTKTETKSDAVSFVPDDVMHSFSMAFDIRLKTSGIVSRIKGVGTELELEANSEGYLAGAIGDKLIKSNKIINDNKWHQIVVSQRFLNRDIQFFLDGELITQINEFMVPIQFILNGDISISFNNLLVYRSALNEQEVKELFKRNLVTGSLEVFVPFNKERLEENAELENIALTKVSVYSLPLNGEAEINILMNKIKKSDSERANELIVIEKKPIKISESICKKYVGKYEIASGDWFEILFEDNKLIFLDRGQKINLLAESESKFFIKFPLAELSVEFFNDENGEVEKLIFRMNENEIPALRIH